jgi:hypothetical protein
VTFLTVERHVKGHGKQRSTMFHPTLKDETMNSDTRGKVRRRGWPRWAAFLVIVAGVTLLTAACGGGGTPAGSGSPSPESTYAKIVVWAQCMRSHGVPNFPDPNSNGTFPGNSFNPQSAAAQSAMKACKSLQPDIGGSPGQLQKQNVARALKYSQCMRSHGVPNYPDPSSSGGTNIPASSGINPQSPAFQKAQQDCQSINPGQVSG